MRRNLKKLNNGSLWVMALKVNVSLCTLFSKFVIVKITRYFIIERTVNVRGVCGSGLAGRRLDENVKKRWDHR